jgi:hypothetical protein
LLGAILYKLVQYIQFHAEKTKVKGDKVESNKEERTGDKSVHPGGVRGIEPTEWNPRDDVEMV